MRMRQKMWGWVILLGITIYIPTLTFAQSNRPQTRQVSYQTQENDLDAYASAFGWQEQQMYGPYYEEGSLWSEASQFNSPFDYEPRGQFKVGDIIVVQVKENFQSRDELRMNNETESSLTFNIANFWSKSLDRSIFGRQDGAIDYPKTNITGTDDYDAQARGNMRSQLIIDIPCTVKKIMEDGRLLIEGRASRIIARDRKSYILSGTVRPEDVDPNQNTVPSTRVAESQIRWEGKGPSQNVMNPGLLNRILDYIPLF